MAEHTERAAENEAGMPATVSAPGRALTIAAMERLVTRIAEGGDPTEGRVGSEYLLFTCGEIPCAVPLVHLREVLPALPAPVPLPFSPPWLLGVFPLRLDVLGLVDPTPLLLGHHAPPPQIGSTATAIVVGDETLLALAVSAVGEIALIQPEQISKGGASGESQEGGPTAIVAAYVLGRCTTESGASYALIDMPRLVHDLVRALTEVATHE